MSSGRVERTQWAKTTRLATNSSRMHVIRSLRKHMLFKVDGRGATFKIVQYTKNTPVLPVD